MTDDLRIDSLEGVGPVTTRKLSDAGVHSIMDLIVRGPVEIAEITGMDKDMAEKTVNKARKHLVEGGQLAKDFVSAAEIYKHRQSIGKITTGTNCLDTLFDGGLETQALTEVYGEFGCGKTQFAHTMSVMVQKPKEEGGLAGSVLYIDTENTFRPERIVSIAKAHGMDPERVLDRIIVARAYNSAHQVLILEEAGTVIKENDVKLIVADSAVGLFRSEYLGRGTLSARQQKLNHFVHLLSRIAETYNCAAIATNQVMASPDIFFGDPTRPIGGNVVAHTSTYRIYFKKSGKKRIARMVDSPHHPEEEVIFALGEAGVIDPEEADKKGAKKAAKKPASKKADEAPAAPAAAPATEAKDPPTGTGTAGAKPGAKGAAAPDDADPIEG
ncbi:DNA repair and recombination protein RadA [Nitrosopumilaceae archaeon]|nr:DNA repair and recombination protein RadA [Nitrosopumilus sp.]CAI9832151.1 DNA repair and recombination protein RadA [Nitrosopumilaceae archaeon]MDA7945352.1 DNA repair and recombination protein RadA [Nitrosopumilus sp.]MDA7954931.1 DNA repair and recombination protein RadA [Nitrosopumilus sp.]MDA7973963.1 DNA repair and recombination protein RadA [Nitrosopumilus sp.]